MIPYAIKRKPDQSGKDWVVVNTRTGKAHSRHASQSQALSSIAFQHAHRHVHLTTNATARPLRADPTRTTGTRQRFVAEVRRRFRALSGQVWDFIAETDALGLGERKSPVFNVQPREYEFRTDEQKLAAFGDWFRGQVDAKVFTTPSQTDPSKPWTAVYVESAYKQGQLNAYLAARRANPDAPALTADSEAFLRDSFGAPESVSKVRLLAMRSWEGLKGITPTMGAELNRILAQGIADGKGPRALAKEMTSKVEGIAMQRAMTLARTETIHAHAEGQLDAFDKVGVGELGVQAEWSTAGDDRVCPECGANEGNLYTVEEARGLIPLHPNCRCSWIPYTAAAVAKTTRGLTGDTKPVAVPAVSETKFATADEYRQAIVKEFKAAEAAAPVKGEATIAAEAERARLEGLVKSEMRIRQTIWDKVRAENRTPTPAENDLLSQSIARDAALSPAIKQATETILSHRVSVSLSKYTTEQAREVLFEKDSLLSSQLARAVANEAKPHSTNGIHTVLEMMPKSAFSAKQVEALSSVEFEYGKLAGQGGAYRHSQTGTTALIRLHKDNAAVAVHEFGHHISYKIPSVMQAQNDLFRARTAGEKTAALKGFSKEIQGKQDKWGTTYRYAGRVYRDGRTPEVISVGVERLYEDPIDFARKDPEWFNMVVSALKGLPNE